MPPPARRLSSARRIISPRCCWNRSWAYAAFSCIQSRIRACRIRVNHEKYGILLILDEVVTMPLDTGGAQGYYNVKPDLTTFGKAIGGGLPLSAYGGRRDVMGLLDPHQHELNPPAGDCGDDGRDGDLPGGRNRGARATDSRGPSPSARPGRPHARRHRQQSRTSTRCRCRRQESASLSASTGRRPKWLIIHRSPPAIAR